MPETTIATIIHESFELKKFDGDPPKPGEDKQPVEIITGERTRIVEMPTRQTE